jgi:hypothetical protein
MLKGILLEDTFSYARMMRPFINSGLGFSGFSLVTGIIISFIDL